MYSETYNSLRIPGQPLLAESPAGEEFTWEVKPPVPLAHGGWVWGWRRTGRVGRLERCWRRWSGWGCRRRITARVQVVYCWWMLLQSNKKPLIRKQQRERRHSPQCLLDNRGKLFPQLILELLFWVSSWSSAQPLFYREKMSHVQVLQSETSRCCFGSNQQDPTSPHCSSPGTQDTLQPPHTFLVSALGRVPNWGSVGLSTGLLISDGTDSVLLIFVTEKQVGEGRKTSLMRLFILAIPSITLKCREFVENYLLGRKDILQAGASLVHLLWHFNLKDNHYMLNSNFFFPKKRKPTLNL